MLHSLYSGRYFLLTAALFFLSLLLLEIGFRIGRRFHSEAPDAVRQHITTLETAVLAIMGLLFAFSFSMAASRYDSRKELVLEEANAIRVVYLTADLIADAAKQEIRSLLKQYLDVRIRFHLVRLESEQLKANLDEMQRLQEAIWSTVARIAKENPESVMAEDVVSSVSDMIEIRRKREYALSNHVPRPILDLLFVASLVSMVTVGFATGAAGHRSPIFTVLLAALVSSVMLVILGLDRPEEGFLRVSQQALLDLKVLLGR